MTNFITDEHGNRAFTHEGWTVRIWGPGNTWARIEVESPRANEQVSPYDDGIWVSGVDHGAWHDGPSAFTIPWPVIGAIIEARAIVG